MNNNWFNTSKLLSNDTLFEIIPNSDMSYSEKINSIIRFTLYLSVLLYLSSGNYLYFYIVLITILIIYLVYVFNGTESFDTYTNNDKTVNVNDQTVNVNDQTVNVTNSNSENCKNPTKNNPLMNPLIGDSTYDKMACDIKDNKILESVDKKFCNKLFQDTSNIFNNRFEQRAFFTSPNTTTPNDQASFAKWLYNTPVMCSIGDTGSHVGLQNSKSCAYNYKTLNEL